MIRRDDLRDLTTLYVRFARPYAPALVLGGFLSVVAAGLTTLQPLVLAPAIDATLLTGATPARTWHALSLNNVGPSLLAWTGLDRATPAWRVLAIVITTYVTLAVLASLTAFVNLLLVNWIRAGLFRNMQSVVYRHLLGLSMSYFVRQRTGDLASRLMNDAYQTAEVVDPVARGLLQGAVHLAVYGFLLVRTDVWLTAGVLAVFAVHLAITRGLRDRIRHLVVDQFDLFAELTSLLQEAFLGIRVVKSFGAERFEYGRFLERARHLGRVMLKGGIYKYAENPLREIADAVGFGLVLVMAFAALGSGRLTLSGLVLYVVVVRQALVPLSQVARSILFLQTLIGSSKRLLEVLEATATVADGAREAQPLREAIRLEDVRFAYQPGLDVLQGVTLEIRRGEMVALVGPSGAGKSTVGDLVIRLYDPTAGRVTYDGVDVREFRQESYRRQFGVVSQECLLFNATVTENIAYGRRVDREAVIRAARIAHADGFIGRLPQGYDTTVGDRGIRLSGGQRQRIAIARAIYGEPAVLVLDEATSALDSESEHHVQAAIGDVIRSVTALVIAHRLSTVTRADRIVVLDNGGIEAEGTHEELLVRSPLYRRLCEAQFREPEAAARGLS